MGVLQNCPNCGSTLVMQNRKKGKYQYECGGDCWTRTNWHWSEMEAKEEWNNLKKDIVFGYFPPDEQEES